MTAAVQTEARFDIVALKQLFESPLNNRKHYDEKKLAELTESVRTKGVLTPLLVRPMNGMETEFEIAAGHRRYRAAKSAGVDKIPVLIREMSDAEFIEVITIENLQREDVHPLDEALGYRELIEKHGYTPETIAAKVGKSESYVYQRMKLAELIQPAQKLFFDGTITAGHAILIARCSEDEQKEIISESDGLLWSDRWYQDDDPHPCSVRSLAQEIKRNLYLDLVKAPWKQNDTKLLPAAGPCTDCPKRSGANPGLFDDIKEKNICTDRKCYNQKLDAFLNRALEDGGLIKVSTEYGSKKTEGVLTAREYSEIHNKDSRCKYTQKAIVVEGHSRGTTKDICSEKTCTKHHARSSGGNNDYKAQQAAEQRKRNIELERRRRIFKAVMEKVPAKLSREDFEVIAKAAWKRQMADHQKLVMKAYGGLEPHKTQYGYDCDKPAFAYIDKASDSDLLKFMIATALGPDLNANSYDYASKGESLLQIAKRYKVNVDKITTEVKAEAKAKEKKKPKVKTSAKTKQAADVDIEEDEDAE